MFDCLLRLAYRSVHLSVYLIGLPVLCGQKVSMTRCVCVCVCARACVRACGVLVVASASGCRAAHSHSAAEGALAWGRMGGKGGQRTFRGRNSISMPRWRREHFGLSAVSEDLAHTFAHNWGCFPTSVCQTSGSLLGRLRGGARDLRLYPYCWSRSSA